MRPAIRFRLLAVLAMTVLALARSSAQRPSAQGAATPEQLMGTALYQEEVEGRPDAAIATYRQVLATTGVARELAARAQFRIGGCYERLGRAEAQRAYEAVVHDFNDQIGLVKQAKARLDALGAIASPSSPAAQSNGRLTARMLWEDVDWYEAAISPDGSMVAFVDMRAGNIGLRQVATGDTRMVTKGPESRPWTDFALGIRWSPDSRRLAYDWERNNDGPTGSEEIRIIDVLTDRESAVAGTRNANLSVEDWSRDGARLLVSEFVKEAAQFRLAWVNVADGARQRVSEPLVGAAMVSPDGRFVASGSPSGMVAGPVAGGEVKPLVTASGQRIQGKIVAWAADGTLLFQSAPPSRDGLWSVQVKDGQASGEPVMIRDDLGSQNARICGVSNSGQLLHYPRAAIKSKLWMSRAQTGTGAWRPGEEQRYSGSDRAKRPLSWSPDGQRLLYSITTPGQASLAVASADGATVRTVSTPFTSIATFAQSTWQSTSRPVVLGYEKGGSVFFQLDSDSGDTTALTAPLPNRTATGDSNNYFALSADGQTVYKEVIYFRDGKSDHLAVVASNPKAGVETEIFKTAGRAGLFAGPLSKDGQWLPVMVGAGARYQLTLLPVAGGPPRVLCQVRDQSMVIAWSAGERSLLFVRPRGSGPGKTDEIWECPVSGGAPRSVGITASAISAVAAHPDGTRVAYIGGVREKQSAWLLENFLPSAGGAKSNGSSLRPVRPARSCPTARRSPAASAAARSRHS